MRHPDIAPQEALTPPLERIVIASSDDTVRLLQLVPGDAAWYRGFIAEDPDHFRQFGDTTADKYPDVESVRRSIESPKDPDKLRFGDWDGDTPVASHNLTPKGDGRAEIGYWVAKRHTGRHYGTRGLRLLANWALTKGGYDEVYCDIVVGNEASRRTAAGAAMTYAGEVIDEEGRQLWRYTLSRD